MPPLTSQQTPRQTGLSRTPARPTHRRQLGVLLLCVALCGACSKKSGAAKGKTNGSGEHVPTPLATPKHPQTWRVASPERTVELTVPSGSAMTGDSPALKMDARTLSLTPSSPRLGKLTWQAKQDDAKIQATGTRGKLTMRWTLPTNDPQARFSMEWRDVPLGELASPIQGTITLPPGKIAYVNHQLARVEMGDEKEVMISAWTPGWIQWSSGEDALTIAQWRADQVTIRRERADGPVTITFGIWNPANHPSLHRCVVPDGGRDAITLRMDVTYVIGRRLTVLPSRLPSGYLASVAPVFIDPRDHHDKSLHYGAPKDAGDWLRRAVTLAHGHSSMRDPRFGNGGLLGGGLGGTLAARADFLEDAGVKEFRGQLGKTRMRLVAHGAGRKKHDAQLVSAEEQHCATLLARRARPSRSLLTLGEPAPGEYLNVLLPRKLREIGDQVVYAHPPSFAPGLPASAYLPVLDGTRAMITDQVLSKVYLQKLAQDRGISWFATPLVATRNPLVRAASEAILEPERQGEWTLATPISRALGHVDLLDDHDIVLFSDISSLLHYWRRVRTLRVYEQPDGALTIHNGGEPLEGFTLVLDGAVPLLVDNKKPALAAEKKGARPRGGIRVVPMPEHQTRQTWAWWPLKKGDSVVTMKSTGKALAPVRWRLRAR